MLTRRFSSFYASSFFHADMLYFVRCLLQIGTEMCMCIENSPPSRYLGGLFVHVLWRCPVLPSQKPRLFFEAGDALGGRRMRGEKAHEGLA